MNIIIRLAAALLPALLLFVYIVRQDPKTEPTSWLRKALLYGVAICIPTALLETFIQSAIVGEPTTLVETTIEAFVMAAVPEEGFKLLALWLLLRRNPYFDEHFDGIVYAVCVSLGFAAVENVFYVTMSDEGWATVAITRALLAVPGHYAFGVLMGYYYSLYHFAGRSPRNAACMLLVPVAAHGIYDTLALSSLVNPAIGTVGFVILIFFCIRMHKAARIKIMAQIEKDKNEKWSIT